MTISDAIKRLIEMKQTHLDNWNNEDVDWADRYLSRGKYEAYENAVIIIKKHIS